MGIQDDERAETIAGFGTCALVRTQSGRYRLQGGSREDRSEAKKWIAQFLPEIVLEDE